MKILLKITSILLIQALLMVNCAWVGTEEIIFVTEKECLSPQLLISNDNFQLFLSRFYLDERTSSFLDQENLLRKVVPGLSEIIGLLEQYKLERIITRYYLTGSFLDGSLNEERDIDFSVVFRRYDNQEALERLLNKAEEISKKSSFKFHITLQAFGHEYEFRNDRFIPTGLIRGEQILSRLENPENKSILRLDNIEAQLLNEDFFVRLYRRCRKFNFAEHTELNEKIKKIKQVYRGITIEDAYPGFTRTIDKEGRDVGIFLVSEIEEVDKIIDFLPIDSTTKACDLGSGIGQVCSLFAARGAQTVGFEIDEKLVALSNWITKKQLSGVIDPEKIEFRRTNIL